MMEEEENEIKRGVDKDLKENKDTEKEYRKRKI